MNPYTQALAVYLREHEPIRAVRVSSAQARGAAKQYSYWGAVRYEVRLAQAGHVTYAPCERASSDRRSYRLAEQDACELSDAEGRLWLQSGPGPLCDADAREVVEYALMMLRERGSVDAADALEREITLAAVAA